MFKVVSEEKGANIPRTIRFTDKLYSCLTSVSKQNNISFNMLVLQCCKYALDNMAERDKK